LNTHHSTLRYRPTYFLTIFSLLILFGCNTNNKTTPLAENAVQVSIDGSSTVFPITEQVISDYRKNFNDLDLQIKVSGTGGGFDKFCEGEIQINNASRAIDSIEILDCEENNIRYQLFEVAYDGIAIVVHPDNDWVDNLTFNELKDLYQADGPSNWQEIRADWPDQPIKFYGPGDNSGTHDFLRTVLTEDASTFRENYTKSENDNLLVKAVSTEPNAIGFFGLAYYEDNKNDLKLVPINFGRGPVTPSTSTVADQSYQYLSRPMYIYVNTVFLSAPEGKKFVQFYLNNAANIASEVGYVPLAQDRYREQLNKIK
jgi:phosphate transport system substrate-binding protein